jgi:hypothetical protein
LGVRGVPWVLYVPGTFRQIVVCPRARLTSPKSGIVTIALIVTEAMRIICKNPDCPRKGRPFTPKRAGAQFCSVRCHVAAHRKQHKRAPAIWWRDDKRRRERKGAQAELAERLLGIA